MCGHVGCAGDIGTPEEKAFHQLLIVDSLRGIDSTGVAVISRTGDVKVEKSVGDAYQLIDRKAYDKAFYGSNRVVIGHNRYATVGNVSNKTAHPFDFSTLVGAHNGTLTTKYRLEDASKFAVDSENLFHHIEKKGLKDALQHMGGAWALVWWDKNEETINFLRNKERTLYITFTDDKKKMFWASESWMLKGVLSRNNIPHAEPVLIGEDNHYSVKVNIDGSMEKTVIRYTPSKYEPVVSYPPYQSHVPPHVPVKQQQQPSTVTALATKKTGVVPLLANSKAGYANKQGVKLEILDVGSDRHGGKYYICFDSDNPGTKIRYYYSSRNANPEERILEKLTADIGQLHIDSVEGSYYKVKGLSVVFDNDLSDDPVEEASVQQYETHTGAMISFDDWVGQYGDCVWCSSPVLPTYKHALTTEGQCLCEHCIDSPEVREYVTIAKEKA